MTLSVLHIASEVTPFSKTGGLADVCSALPRALAKHGLKLAVVTPRYRAVDPARHSLARRLQPMEVTLAGVTEKVTIYEGRLPGGRVPVYLVDHPLFDREGIYGEGGADYPDNARRFALLARAALELADKGGFWPDILHVHDWQTGIAPYFARHHESGRKPPRVVFTVHNLAFQGLVPKSIVEELGLGWDAFTPETGEFFDQLSLLKLGLAFADRITTVSPRYAREIQTPEHGAGLDGFLRARADRLVGILNGIDTDVWDPARDPHLAAPYSADDLTGKSGCQVALQRLVGLPPRSHVPIFGWVSRLTEQKGVGLVLDAGDELASLDAQYVFLGSGERRYEEGLASLARRHPTKVAIRLGYDEPMAHRIEGGANFFLMPSRFEPCGLNQMYSLRYGTVPVVRATGGLDDTVVDYDEATRTGTGFKFDGYTPSELAASVKRAASLWERKDDMAELAARIMRIDHGWHVSARRYLEVYNRLLGEREKTAA